MLIQSATCIISNSFPGTKVQKKIVEFQKINEKVSCKKKTAGAVSQRPGLRESKIRSYDTVRTTRNHLALMGIEKAAGGGAKSQNVYSLIE